MTRTVSVSTCHPRTLPPCAAPLRPQKHHCHLHLRERQSRHYLLVNENRRRLRRLTTRRRTYKESVLKAAAPEIFHQAFVNHICKQKGPFSGNSIHWSSNHLIDYTKSSLQGRNHHLHPPTFGNSHNTCVKTSWEKASTRTTPANQCHFKHSEQEEETSPHVGIKNAKTSLGSS